MPASKASVFLRNWAINAVAVLVAAHLVRGIQYDSVIGLLIAAFILGILNVFLRPMLLLFSLPLLLVTLGLFTLVINALLLYFVGWLVESFHVDSFGAAFWGALVISLVSFFANWLTGTPQARFTIRTQHRSKSPPPGPGSGPIIDV